MVFTQDFEGDYATWSNTPVDFITELQYFNHTGTSGSSAKIWLDEVKNGDNPWQTPADLIRTDSVTPGYAGQGIALMNGVMTTDAKKEVKNYENDTYTLMDDQGDETRNQKLAKFGEDGGEKFFKYESDSAHLTEGKFVNWSYQQVPTAYAPSYRRNLFVRLKKGDIQPETSYRLTFYVKATKTNTGDERRMYAGVYRGYFHGEKPFSNGMYDYDKTKSPYTHAKGIEYQKDNFTGDWEKVVYMTYYLNDTIAQNFVFKDGYHWADSTGYPWDLGRDINGDGVNDTLYFIKQPDKYFVRISFSSDKTLFQFDNLSLTKSTIAGVEYDKDKLRVDFGYKTNLADQAKAAYEKNLIDAVEVPGEYFEVWTYKKGDGWEEMPIRSAEYQGDGYMYMFTDGTGSGENFQPFLFNDYDSVLVTFHNPTDRNDIVLKYTGTGESAAELYPHALDVDWVKAGKVVDDFYNEVATPNPYVFDNIFSMMDRPPVLQKPPYENGSFGLTSTNTMEFGYSKKVKLDDKGETSDLVCVRVNGKIWNVSHKPGADSVLVATNPNPSEVLSGDVTVNIYQIQGVGTRMREDQDVLNYHFGNFERNPQITFITQSNWRADISDYDGLGQDDCPVPTSVYLHTGKQNFGKGTGVKMTKCGFYPTQDDTITVLGTKIPDNGMFYLSGQTKTGNLYSIVNLNKGNYVINFKLAGRNTTNYPMGLKFYAKPAGELADGNDKGFAVLEAVTNKTVLEAGKKPDVSMGYQFPTTKTWDAKTILCSYPFSVPADGDYVFEWTVTSSDNNGIVISNYWITTAGDLSFAYTTALNNSVEAANARIALAEAKPEFGGALLQDLKTKAEYYKINGAFDGEHKTKPSEWNAAKAALNKATDTLKLRMDSVQLFIDVKTAAADKLTDMKADYENLSTYKALKSAKEAADAYDATDKTFAELFAYRTSLNNAIKALDARIVNNKAFDDALTKAKALVEDKNAKDNYTEFAELEQVYDDAKVFDAINATDDELAAVMALVEAANYNYNVSIYIDTVGTKRIYALQKIAQDLGSQIDTCANVKNSMDTLRKDNDELAAVYMAAIKAAIYEKAKDIKDTLDLTPFIKNYYLYTTPKIQVMDASVQQPANRDAHKKVYPGKNVADTHHQHSGQRRIFIILTNQTFTDLVPGWSVRAVDDNSGNDQVSTDICTTNDDGLVPYPNYFAGKPVFDGAISMDWGGEAQLSQDVIGLPAGNYELGIETNSQYKYSEKNNAKGTSTLKATIAGRDTSIQFQSAYFDTVTVGVDGSHVNDTTIASYLGKLAVNDGDTLNIYASLKTGNGNAAYDNFSLKFIPREGVNYDALVDAAKAEITEALTVVKAIDAVAENVEYYTLSGMKLAAPKQGEILIRKTTQANGKIKVDKVIIR
ncbi:MAG: hypothetical protein J5596_00970 [Bacteroidaceae bacterium]|nr:hypothetical protein [Bacteroidaceae bacterium]